MLRRNVRRWRNSVNGNVRNSARLSRPENWYVSPAALVKGKGQGFPYSIPSVGPGADPGVQAVSLQVTVKSSTRR